MNSELAGTVPVEAIERAAEAVARAKVLVVSATVEGLDYCEAELAAAIEYLEDLGCQWDPSGALAANEIRIRAQQIRRDASDLGQLLKQAMEFNAGLTGLSEASLAGYTASGAPAQRDREHSRMEMKG